MVKSVLVSILALVSLASAASSSKWNSPITYPTIGTVWSFGKTYTVKWRLYSDGVKIPDDATGSLHLHSAKDNRLSYPLRFGFSLSKGYTSVQIPSDLFLDGSFFLSLKGVDSNGNSTRTHSDSFWMF
ncbi:hypothetical protein BDF14DRAFT_137221 [Spinellus fusiger]|nr:hypothetical protein BDF14DRAFT_137221 [Spinellus fusiger]